MQHIKKDLLLFVSFAHGLHQMQLMCPWQTMLLLDETVKLPTTFKPNYLLHKVNSLCRKVWLSLFGKSKHVLGLELAKYSSGLAVCGLVGGMGLLAGLV